MVREEELDMEKQMVKERELDVGKAEMAGEEELATGCSNRHGKGREVHREFLISWRAQEAPPRAQGWAVQAPVQRLLLQPWIPSSPWRGPGRC